IGVALAHSGEEDEPLDLESESKEDLGDDMEAESIGEEDEGAGPSEEADSDCEWHDTQEILREANEEVNVERENMVSEETLGGDDES
ncbi:hypothetical protein KI387_023627, partial [Taxus chinensis]